MRVSTRPLLVAALAGVLATPLAQAQETPTVQPSPSGGSAFGPLQGLGGAPTTETTVTNTGRPEEEGASTTMLLGLSGIALLLIGGVVWMIWREGRSGAATQRRRKRLRSGRTPQPATAGGAGPRSRRSGPPPPPRKRKAQAKRKKR